jgi:hypothetical protein
MRNRPERSNVIPFPIRKRIMGQLRLARVDVSEVEHLMECPVCGVTFDTRDLDQALQHVHDGPECPPVIIR